MLCYLRKPSLVEFFHQTEGSFSLIRLWVPVERTKDFFRRMEEDEQKTWPRVAKGEMDQFVQRCMKSLGMKDEYAKDLAELLVAADYRGHYSHGLNRLGKISPDLPVIIRK